MNDNSDPPEDAGVTRMSFAITTADGYEVEVEAVAGGPIFLRIEHPHGNGVQAALTAHQASSLATAVELSCRSVR